MAGSLDALGDKSRIVRKTVTDLVAEKLRDQIMSGRLLPGSALRQEALAEELGVSRIPLREAFQILKSEGLVTVHSHRGTFVTPLLISEVEELFEMRRRLEPWLVQEAVPHIQKSDLALCEQVIREMDDVDAQDWAQLNWKLHKTLYAPANRPTALGVVTSLHDKCERYLRLQVLNGKVRKQAHLEHSRMLEACRKGDAVLAAELVEAHVREAGEQVVGIVGKIIGGAAP